MPTPIGHSLAGLAVYLGAGRRSDNRWWAGGALAVALANLPDIDFLPGYLTADPRGYHWGATHSIAAALIAGTLVGWWFRRRGGRFGLAFMVAAAAYLSHILLDLLLGPGPAPSIGLQVFWPVSTDRLMLPWSVFRMAPASIATIGPIRALFSAEILPVIAREVLLLAPAVLAAWGLRKVSGAIRAPRSSRSSSLNECLEGGEPLA